MDISQNQAYGAVAETTFQETGNAHLSVSNAQGDDEAYNNHDDDNEYLDIMLMQDQEESFTYEDLSHTPYTSPEPPPPSYEELVACQHQVSSAPKLQQYPNNAGSIRVTSNMPPPLAQQQSTAVMQRPTQVQMQTHTPGIVQPATAFYTYNPDYVRENVQKSNEGLCGRFWCCYSIPFCAVYSVIILICFFIIGSPLTIFWSIPSTVLLILGAKKRNKTFITIGLGINICFGIWSFFILGPPWGFCLTVIGFFSDRRRG